MTTKKKTGDQLVASIRKSKTSVVAKKSTRRAPVKSTSSDAVQSMASNSRPAQSQQDRYSRGGRVWPD
jgi:hypothetical protein